MKIAEWNGIGQARELIAHQLEELGAEELAAHVTANPDTGRQRILVATDMGLLEYTWSASTPEPNAPWHLRGAIVRWPGVHGLRLQTDAEWDPASAHSRSVWRLVAEDPKLDLAAHSSDDESDRSVSALLAFARACLVRTGQAA